MKRYLLFFGILIVLGLPSKAQFKNPGLMETYSKLSRGLEPIRQKPVPDTMFFVSWMDTIVSIHGELAAYLGVTYPLDTLLLEKAKQKEVSPEEENRIAMIKLIKKFPNRETTSFCWREKQKRKRGLYEEQRLSMIKGRFDAVLSKSDQDAMGALLQLMSFYYEHRPLLSDRSYKKYEKEFIAMRNQYANLLASCLNKKTCNQKHISILFGVSANAWPDLNLAYGVLKKWYSQEWLYLFLGGDLHRLENVTFLTASEYLLSVLYLYNIAGKTEFHELVRAFDQLNKLQFTSWKKNTMMENLRQYLNEKQKVFPLKY